MVGRVGDCRFYNKRSSVELIKLTLKEFKAIASLVYEKTGIDPRILALTSGS